MGVKTDWTPAKIDALLDYYNNVEGDEMNEKQVTNHKPYEEPLTVVSFNLYVRAGGVVTLEHDVLGCPSIKHLLVGKTIALEVIEDAEGYEVLVLTAK